MGQEITPSDYLLTHDGHPVVIWPYFELRGVDTNLDRLWSSMADARNKSCIPDAFPREDCGISFQSVEFARVIGDKVKYQGDALSRPTVAGANTRGNDVHHAKSLYESRGNPPVLPQYKNYSRARRALVKALESWFNPDSISEYRLADPHEGSFWAYDRRGLVKI